MRIHSYLWSKCEDELAISPGASINPSAIDGVTLPTLLTLPTLPTFFLAPYRRHQALQHRGHVGEVSLEGTAPYLAVSEERHHVELSHRDAARLQSNPRHHQHRIALLHMADRGNRGGLHRLQKSRLPAHQILEKG